VLVAIHDDTVDRTTNGSGAVRDLTLAELKALDAGYHFTPDGGQTYPYRGMGLTIPTVEEIFAAFPEAYYLIEIKQSEPLIVEDLIAAMTEHGVRERVLLASFDDEPMLAARALAPDVLTSMSASEMVELFNNMENPEYTPPARYAQPPWELALPEVVEFAHALGVKVQPWTVNNAKVMQDLLALEVDGIMTDDPALLAMIVPP
ncbi:MAG TPA: glycerophosphodiester phosphodiesterase, partial [Nannocystis sp.]